MYEKPRPNHQLYLQSLRRMSPDERLNKMFELSKFARDLFKQGLRKRFATLNDEEFHEVYLARLARCHNRNY